MKEIQFSDEAKQAIDLIQNSSANVFVTGKAGTGKSTLLEHVRNNANSKTIVLAPTGVAAINIDDHNRISTTDNRLVRRIVRDYRYRKYSARETISRWPSVRKGEEKHIFPFQEEADIMFNSALLYELAVLKPFAEPILLEVQPNQPEYSEATSTLKRELWIPMTLKRKEELPYFQKTLRSVTKTIK